MILFVLCPKVFVLLNKRRGILKYYYKQKIAKVQSKGYNSLDNYQVKSLQAPVRIPTKKRR